MFRNKSTFIFYLCLLNVSGASAIQLAIGLEDISPIFTNSPNSSSSAAIATTSKKIPTGFLTAAEVVSLHQTMRDIATKKVGQKILYESTPVARRILEAKDQWGESKAAGYFRESWAQFFLNSRTGEEFHSLRDLPEGYGSELWHMTPLMGHYVEEIRGKEVADIGCATGISVIFAKLYGEPKETLAIDLDPSNLKLLLTHFESPQKEQDPRLNIEGIALGLGKFSSEIKLEPNSRDAILISNVLHHMDPDQVRATLENAAAALRPGGKIYIQALTPKEAPRGRFEVHVESDSDGDNLWPFFRSEVPVGYFRHPFNLAILRRELARVGLVPERQGYYSFYDTRKTKLPLADEPIKDMDWRGLVGIIAQKQEKNVSQ